jgi:hypothetical protein
MVTQLNDDIVSILVRLQAANFAVTKLELFVICLDG